MLTLSYPFFFVDVRVFCCCIHTLPVNLSFCLPLSSSRSLGIYCDVSQEQFSLLYKYSACVLKWSNYNTTLLLFSSAFFYIFSVKPLFLLSSFLMCFAMRRRFRVKWKSSFFLLPFFLSNGEMDSGYSKSHTLHYCCSFHDTEFRSNSMLVLIMKC